MCIYIYIYIYVYSVFEGTIWRIFVVLFCLVMIVAVWGGWLLLLGAARNDYSDPTGREGHSCRENYNPPILRANQSKPEKSFTILAEKPP